MTTPYIIKSIVDEMANAFTKFRQDETLHIRIAEAAKLLSDSFQGGGRAYSCGNGGSHCDAMHFAEELSGRFRDDRRPLGAIAISDAAHITCTGNDLGFDEIFSRFIWANGRRGDVLLAISTSGKSPNILKAAEKAQSLSMKVVALTGREGSALGKLADIDLCTPVSKYADRAQELHIKIIHILIELIERQMFSENY